MEQPIDPGLCQFALRHRLDEFIEYAAPHHSFHQVCLAVAATRSLTLDHAVGVVDRRWPRWPLHRPLIHNP